MRFYVCGFVLMVCFLFCLLVAGGLENGASMTYAWWFVPIFAVSSFCIYVMKDN